MNRLAGESSPYLLQHADNPVDWHPWGDTAFARARETGRPIFLSIGYSTCHWCHVMAHESFENVDVAAILNEHFVSIKLDREERPDVDRVYMAFVQATTGSGGWPMSVWLTPELRPFYGGTYFPPTARWQRPGFVDILQEIARVWQTERGRVEESAASIVDRMRQREGGEPASEVPSTDVLTRTVNAFAQSFDARRGGFGGAPKFPRPSELLFLLREHHRTGDGPAIEMVERTLGAMASGGMRDHVGGGFHRYAVDAEWRVPHFEKMLYDQAQLTLAYLGTAQELSHRGLAEVADDTIRYVLREMTHPEGGFYSAEDADSVPPEEAAAAAPHRREGAFYLWTAAELRTLLGDDADLVIERFGVEAEGNAPTDPQQEFTGKNILYVRRSLNDLASDHRLAVDEVAARLGRARLAMFTARLARPRPHLDDKVLTAWNGLMIAALARAARVLPAACGDPGAGREAREAAIRAARFVRRALWDEPTGRLLRRWRDGKADIDGYAEDYAYLVFGLLELFQIDPDPAWLAWAVALQRRQDDLFWDEAEGGWFGTSGRDASVLLRMKEDYDGAEPSASSVSVLNLLTLAQLIDEPAWTERVERTLRLFGARLEQMGRAVPMMATALSTYHAGPSQVVVVGDGSRESLAAEVLGRHLPGTVVLVLDAEALTRLQPSVAALAGMRAPATGACAHICRGFTCGLPIRTVDELRQALDRRS